MTKDILYGIRIPRWIFAVVLTLEYGVLFYNPALFERSVLFIAGVFMLSMMLTCNGHWRSVHLQYEQELSIFIKAMVTDIIISVFQVAYQYDSLKDMHEFFNDIGLLFLIHAITVIFLCCCNMLMRKSDDNKKCLYIYENNSPQEVDEALMISVTADVDSIQEKICASDYVYLYDISSTARNSFLKLCFQLKKPVFYSTKISDAELRIAHLAQNGDKPILFSEQYTISGPQRVIKRIFDVVCCSLAMIVLSPMFLIIMICIKCEDGGSVFYRQVRCTEGLKEFQLLKFRSMVMDAENISGPALSGQRDPRLTKCGAVIRRFKFDELPQLINIIKGDMSIVGPRPERPELINETLREMPEFSLRNSIKAGLTGYAQVHGNYYTSFYDKLKWDLLYIENFSLLLDLKIILMTVPTVIRGTDDMRRVL